MNCYLREANAFSLNEPLSIFRKKQPSRPLESAVDPLVICNTIEKMKTEIDDLKNEIKNLKIFLLSPSGRQYIQQNQENPLTTLTKQSKTQQIQATDLFDSIETATYNPDDQEAYHQIINLIKNKQFPEALEKLTRFLKQYKHSAYHILARQWLGDVYSETGELGLAKTVFIGLMQEFKTHDLVPTWLYKLAETHQKAKELEIAKIYYIELTTKYPKNSAARLAEQKLKTIKSLK